MGFKYYVSRVWSELFKGLGTKGDAYQETSYYNPCDRTFVHVNGLMPSESVVFLESNPHSCATWLSLSISNSLTDWKSKLKIVSAVRSLVIASSQNFICGWLFWVVHPIFPWYVWGRVQILMPWICRSIVDEGSRLYILPAAWGHLEPPGSMLMQIVQN